MDTGSPYTSISPRDALSWHLPITHWQKGETVYLAGFKFYRHPLEATLSFKDSDARVVKFRSSVVVLVPTKIDRTTLAETQSIPSLVGTDFIEEQGLTLVFTPHSLQAYFEKPDATPALTEATPTEAVRDASP